jgi:hypothetical protein
MKIERTKINNIPSIVWGEKSSKVFIAVHGNMSNKENLFQTTYKMQILLKS